MALLTPDEILDAFGVALNEKILNRDQRLLEVAKSQYKKDKGVLNIGGNKVNITLFEKIGTHALELGFKFDWQEWIPDDDSNRIVGQWKVTYPDNWKHPSIYINDGDLRALQYAINEYLRRDEITRETIKHNQVINEGMPKLKTFFQ